MIFYSYRVDSGPIVRWADALINHTSDTAIVTICHLPTTIISDSSTSTQLLMLLLLLL